MYTTIDYKTKTALKNAVRDGLEVHVFQPGPFGDGVDYSKYTGTVYVEGPHYPQPHRWYAQAQVKDGVIVKVT